KSDRTGEALFTDFPRLGWNADAYVVSFNMFGFLSTFLADAPVQYNMQLVTIDKAKLLDPNNPTLSYHQVDRPLPNSTLVPAMVQQGEINPGPGIDTFMPSVALAADGTIGMTYIQSAAGVEDMSMYVTGRAPSDPLGKMQAGVKVSPDPLPNHFYNYNGSRI